MRHLSIAIAAALTLVASTAFASQGRIEISPHDVSPTSPTFTISEPGSYVLTGVLTQHDPGASVIAIATSDVTLDLAGFGVVGSWTAGQTTTGSAAISASVYKNVRIHNGFVRATPGPGVWSNNSADVQNVRVFDVGGTGITGRIVRDCQVNDARTTGINARAAIDCRVDGVAPNGSQPSSGIVATRWVRGCEVDVEDGHAVSSSGKTLLVSDSYLRVEASSLQAIAVAMTGVFGKLAMSNTAYFVTGTSAPASNANWTDPSGVTSAGNNMKVVGGD